MHTVGTQWIAVIVNDPTLAKAWVTLHWKGKGALCGRDVHMGPLSVHPMSIGHGTMFILLLLTGKSCTGVMSVSVVRWAVDTWIDLKMPGNHILAAWP
mmetsp:Transcript_7341/g.16696  ORF Transcript_7341/g.16696 Transcript_7341/m.16696 type:complete len:98 (-) Transcript_7341:402-695(-)